MPIKGKFSCLVSYVKGIKGNGIEITTMKIYLL